MDVRSNKKEQSEVKCKICSSFDNLIMFFLPFFKFFFLCADGVLLTYFYKAAVGVSAYKPSNHIFSNARLKKLRM